MTQIVADRRGRRGAPARLASRRARALRGLARWPQVRHALDQGARRWTPGRKRTGAHSCASTIPDMACPREPSRTARYRTGSRTHSPSCGILARDAPSSSDRRWVPGSPFSPPASFLKAGADHAPVGHRPDRPCGRFHRAADVGPVSRRHQARLEETGVYRRPSSLFRRALPDHPLADRGRAAPPALRRAHRDRLPGACPAGDEGRGRALGPRAALVEHLPGDSVSLTLIKDGDHRLSRPEDIDRLIARDRGHAEVKATTPSAG